MNNIVYLAVFGFILYFIYWIAKLSPFGKKILFLLFIGVVAIIIFIIKLNKFLNKSGSDY